MSHVGEWVTHVREWVTHVGEWVTHVDEWVTHVGECVTHVGVWHMPPGILINLPGLAALMYLWYRKHAPGVYKQANFSQIHQYRLDSCFSWRSHSQSTIASPGGPMPSRLELAPLPSAWANEEAAGCWLMSPLERHIENCRGSSTTGIADSFTVPTQEEQSHLSWHHYGPRKSLSSCPLKRHISTRLCTTNSAFIVPTQEAHQHSPLHY